MYQQIQDLLDKIGPYPEKPHKPVLYSSHDSKRIRAHADAFAEYEVKFVEFEAQRIDYYKRQSEIEHEIKALITHESGLSDIPIQYRTKVWDVAWEKGHSSGYYEVYQWLCRLVEIFE